MQFLEVLAIWTCAGGSLLKLIDYAVNRATQEENGNELETAKFHRPRKLSPVGAKQ